MDDLIVAARSGNPTAREQLLTTLRPRLRQWAEHAISERMAAKIDASDLTQITLLDFHRRLDQFLGTTEGELNEWLRRTLQRNIIDEVRRATAKKRDFGREQAGRGPDESGSSPIEQLPDDERGPGSRLILLEDSDRLRKALHQILPDQQQAIRLVYIEHLSLPEAAARLGRSPGAVAKLLKRGIESLRALLKEMPDPQAE